MQPVLTTPRYGWCGLNIPGLDIPAVSYLTEPHFGLLKALTDAANCGSGSFMIDCEEGGRYYIVLGDMGIYAIEEIGNNLQSSYTVCNKWFSTEEIASQVIEDICNDFSLWCSWQDEEPDEVAANEIELKKALVNLLDTISPMTTTEEEKELMDRIIACHI